LKCLSEFLYTGVCCIHSIDISSNVLSLLNNFELDVQSVKQEKETEDEAFDLRLLDGNEGEEGEKAMKKVKMLEELEPEGTEIKKIRQATETESLKLSELDMDGHQVEPAVENNTDSKNPMKEVRAKGVNGSCELSTMKQLNEPGRNQDIKNPCQIVDSVEDVDEESKTPQNTASQWTPDDHVFKTPLKTPLKVLKWQSPSPNRNIGAGKL